MPSRGLQMEYCNRSMSLERAEHKVNALHPRCGCDLFSLCPAEPACCLPAAKTGSDACDGFSFICPIRGGIFLISINGSAIGWIDRPSLASQLVHSFETIRTTAERT